MARKSARILGKEIGMNAREFNKRLEAAGLLKRSNYVTMKGSPTWDITEKGKRYGELSELPYGFAIWDDEVVDIIMKNT